MISIVMKKTFLFFCMLMMAGAIHAQDTTLAGIVPVDESGMITWQGVVQVPGKSKDDLYKKGIEWVNSYFPNASSVTKKRSPEDGLIEGAYSIRLTDEVNGQKVPSKTINYRFKLEFRDGRFRYTINEFTLKADSRFPLERWLDKKGPYYDIKNKPYLEQIRDTINEMIGKMTSFITKPDKPEEEEW
jgi:hypothetical protein